MKHIACTLIVAAGILAGCAAEPQGSPQGSSSASSQPQLMFVHSSDRFRADTAAQTFRLVNVNQQTLYFADRPQRIAGHIKMADYLKTWGEGADNFGQDPPNATLSILESGQAEQALVVVTISKPVIDGGDLVYSYKILDGTMPASGGATSLFIDWIGVGGGVGPGYHGVGVGRRGVGWR